jgi:hypothetical protein
MPDANLWRCTVTNPITDARTIGYSHGRTPAELAALTITRAEEYTAIKDLPERWTIELEHMAHNDAL